MIYMKIIVRITRFLVESEIDCSLFSGNSRKKYCEYFVLILFLVEMKRNNYLLG